eukprot:TRINITY_DN19402_c0_g2_i1.p1 TRINITY_DN19402_c0_g2~~TRINITY_DN19402_c0_g2_i1.p1  ORF type:complete len:542 (+),score=142.04 TRINITY_DN19402_c0_g2_i1:129-1628(+)
MDEFEKEWDGAAAEAENDVVSLALSFTLTQALRAAIGGNLPNAEGKDPEGTRYSWKQALLLWLAGALLLTLAIGLFLLKVEVMERVKKRAEAHAKAHHAAHAAAAAHEGGVAPHGGEEEQREGGLQHKAPTAEAAEDADTGSSWFGGSGSSSSSGGYFSWLSVSSLVDTIASLVEAPEEEEDGSSSDEEEEEEEGFSRFTDIMTTTFAMGFAWCSFYGWRWLLGNSIASESTLGVVLALVVSFVSFAMIFGLDKVADRMEDSEYAGQIGKVCRMVIKCLGLVIGFAWEQCFDGAVDTLSEVSHFPHLTKLFFACFCAVLLIPAWRWYILPMVEEGGWKYGFVVHDHWVDEKLHKARGRLERHLRRRAKPRMHQRSAKPAEESSSAVLRVLSRVTYGTKVQEPPAVPEPPQNDGSGSILGTAYSYLPGLSSTAAPARDEAAAEGSSTYVGYTAGAAVGAAQVVWGYVPSLRSAFAAAEEDAAGAAAEAGKPPATGGKAGA